MAGVLPPIALCAMTVSATRESLGSEPMSKELTAAPMWDALSPGEKQAWLLDKALDAKLVHGGLDGPARRTPNDLPMALG
jgi:hypothetical protein